MGYGDYSYITDKTKGHVQQYYVDKFRVASDFGRGSAPKSDADAMLGRDAKGAVLIPKGGVPQELDPVIKADMADMPEDPRVAESEGKVWAWDAGYEDPEFAPETFADIDDEEVADQAFAAFMGASQSERGAVLGELDAALDYRVKRIQAGLSENYLLTMAGKYEANYGRLQKIKETMQFTPTGAPQTEIPGFDYLPGIGALDFMEPAVNEKNGAFWKTPKTAEVVYQKPMGANAPELPYNGTPSLEQMQAASAAKGILPQKD